MYLIRGQIRKVYSDCQRGHRQSHLAKDCHMPATPPDRPIRSTMMQMPLSLNHLLERAGHLFAGNEVVSRLPDKSLRRHTYGEFYARAAWIMVVS